MKRIARRVHVVATALLGIQLVIWALTGFAFTLFDFAEVHGDRERGPAEVLDPAALRVPVTDAMAAARAGRSPDARLVDVALRALAGRPVYAFTFATDGDPVLIDGIDGSPRSIAASDAEAIARRAYRGAAGVLAVDRLDAPSDAPDIATPTYRVRIADAKNTEVFVSATTGEITSWRNDTWRRFDALWSLHVMGYSSRTSPAHWPLRLAGGVAVLAALSGAALLATLAFRSARRRRGAVS